MGLFVKLVASGVKITLEVESSDRIDNVKSKIQVQTGDPVDKQVLTRNAIVLENQNTVGFYGIQEGDTLDLLVLP
ncbi:ubiquitin-like protein [Streptomyces sp. NPDC051207]|uniref:ubiquitin-like protein n=1 Tax=Streptomyces sp. NPDC051207 TaxID=3154641 RepID=UPI003441504A